MSVILQIGNFGVAQGWSGVTDINVTNSGTENVKEIYLKIIDNSVYETLTALVGSGQWNDCLNVFTSDFLRFYSGATYVNFLPASTTYTLKFTLAVNAGAPIQTNNLVCYWEYITY